MKLRTFLAMMIFGLISVAFTACSDNEDDDMYSWKVSFVLTDPGDLSALEIEILNQAFKNVENQSSYEYISVAQAQIAFNTMVAEFEKNLQSQSLENKKAIKITISLVGEASPKGDFSRTITINPK